MDENLGSEDQGADILTEEQVEREIYNAEREEENLNRTFRRSFGQSRSRRLKRLSCLAHTLRLVMGSFEKFRKGRRVPAFQKVIKKARSLITSFNMSLRANTMLIGRAGKKLIHDVATRWSSTYLMLVRLLILKKFIQQICGELGLRCLTSSDWAVIKIIVRLLKPFAAYTQLVTSSAIPTLSSVIPIVEELRLHLAKVSEKFCDFYIRT